MCVTGCPRAQADHAIRMARFANECQLKLTQMRERLIERLGPETAELAIRIGLHSGPGEWLLVQVVFLPVVN
jgi:class 3 adenylate cyclase